MMRWWLVFHLLGMVSWVGALLLASKLLATHSQERNPEARQVLAKAEGALFRGWAHPGAAIMVGTGILLIYTNPDYYLSAGWLHMKLLFVLLLIGLHFWLYFRTKAVAAGRRQLSRAASGVLHGGLVLILLLILGLVFFKPFEP